VGLAGQYVDVRFLFEVNNLALQAELRNLRVEVLGTEQIVDKKSLTKDEAVRLVERYAPKRQVAQYGDRGGTEAILSMGLEPVLEYFSELVKQDYADFVRSPSWKRLEEVIDWAHVQLDELLPSGPVFEKCLKLAVHLHLAPHRVYLHGLFGDAIVEKPWHPALEGKLRWERPKNFGPYVGRLPPARWKALGLGQCIQNLIRVWTCWSLERTGLGARGALEVWNQLDFHDNPAELYTDRTTSPAERNYKRDKDWLRRRLSLMVSPLADLDPPPGLLQPRGLDFEKAGHLSSDEYIEIGKRLFAIDYFPDI
jgi:hypothetical protein